MDTSSSSPLLVASLDLIESSTAALKVIRYEQEFSLSRMWGSNNGGYKELYILGYIAV